MEEDWKEYKARNFCSSVTDGTHDSPKPKEEGRYLITSKHLKDNQIDFSSANRISEEDYLKVIARSAVEQFDILFSMIGTIGNVVQVKCKDVDFAVKNMGIFKMGGQKQRSTWLYYWLKSNYASEYINQRLSGSTQSYLTLESLRDFPILYPGDVTAGKIVSILKSLDDKIECNRRINDNFAFSFLLLTCFVLWLLKLINDNLLQQARALYKSWFIDFEPFKGGEFEDSELGMIPHGWSVKQLGEITTQVNEKVKERVDVKVLSPITSGELVLSEEYFTKQVFSESISKYIVVKPTYFAYNPARVNIGSLGMNEYGFDGCVSPVYVVFRCEDDYQYFFDLFRRTETFKEEVKARAIGGVRQSLTYKDFSLIKVVYPPIDVIHSFNQVYSRILAKTKHNNVETTRLASIRDTLLPKLMSGELKIS